MLISNRRSPGLSTSNSNFLSDWSVIDLYIHYIRSLSSSTVPFFYSFSFIRFFVDSSLSFSVIFKNVYRTILSVTIHQVRRRVSSPDGSLSGFDSICLIRTTTATTFKGNQNTMRAEVKNYSSFLQVHHQRKLCYKKEHGGRRDSRNWKHWDNQHNLTSPRCIYQPKTFNNDKKKLLTRTKQMNVVEAISHA